MKSLGYLSSARYGLTFDELITTLEHGNDRKEEETPKETTITDPPRRKSSLKDLADNSLEEWLLGETLVEKEESVEHKESVVPMVVQKDPTCREKILKSQFHTSRIRARGFGNDPKWYNHV